MRTADLEVDDRGTTWRVVFEEFRDALEFDAVVSSRPPRTRTQKANDRLYSDPEARGRLLGTVRGPGIEGLGGYDRDGLRVREDELLDREEHDTAGDWVDVPEFLSGEPECMVHLESVPVDSRIVELVVSMSVPWSRTEEEILRAGTAVVRTVSRLERIGYRVSVRAADSFCDPAARTALVCGIHVKPEWAPLDSERLMYFLADTSFPRAAMFSWAVRHPEWTDPVRMGVPMDHAFKEKGTPSMLARRLLGEHAVLVGIEDVMGQPEPERWLEALLIGSRRRSELAGTDGREPLVLHGLHLPADPGHLLRGEAGVLRDLRVGAVLLHVVEYAVQVLVADAHLLLVRLALPQAGGGRLGYDRLRDAYQAGDLADLRLVEVRKGGDVAGPVPELGEVAHHELALVRGPHDDVVPLLGEVVEDDHPAPGGDVAPLEGGVPAGEEHGREGVHRGLYVHHAVLGAPHGAELRGGLVVLRRGDPRGHEDIEDLPGADSIDAELRDDGGVDASAEAHDDPLASDPVHGRPDESAEGVHVLHGYLRDLDCHMPGESPVSLLTATPARIFIPDRGWRGMRFEVALCQVRPVPGDADENADTMARVLEKGSSDLAVFPECFLEGYGSEPDGDAVRRNAAVLWEVCRDTGRALAFGAAVPDSDGVHNSLILITPQEETVYDKTHLARFGIYAENGFVPGDGPVNGRFRDVGIGLSVCYDIYFPEVLHACTLDGAQLNICVSAAAVPSEQYFDRILPARALENVSYLAFVNNCGTMDGLEMAGGSRALDPLGREIVRCGRDDEIARFVFDTERVDEARSIRHHLEDFRRDIDWLARSARSRGKSLCRLIESAP